MPEVAPAPVPFQEAIDFLRQKVRMPSRTWTDLKEGAHARAFVVAGATSDALVADFQKAVQRAIDEGRTLADFRKDFDTIVERHGWDYNGGRNWRSRVIFDTNMRMARAAGRWAQIERRAAREKRAGAPSMPAISRYWMIARAPSTGHGTASPCRSIIRGGHRTRHPTAGSAGAPSRC